MKTMEDIGYINKTKCQNVTHCVLTLEDMGDMGDMGDFG
jgi:hypothetical protein